MEVSRSWPSFQAAMREWADLSASDGILPFILYLDSAIYL